MKFNEENIKINVYALIVLMVILFISHQLLNTRTKAFVIEKYTNVANEMKTTTRFYIDAKKESILFIALSLANDKRFSDLISSSQYANFELDAFSETLQNKSNYKNVWFQVLDHKGLSYYRSWTDRHGDDLSKVRKDVVKMIENPKIFTTISTGIFDMTFKAMVPIYKEGKFIGSIEVISKFNSVAEQLLNKGYEPVFLLDKSYKDQITKPFTKMFLDDYYIANLNASESNQKYIQNYGVEKIIFDPNDYIIDTKNNRFITKCIQNDVNGNNMGYFVLFQPLENIDLSDIYFFHKAVLFFISLLLVGIYLALQLIRFRHNNEKAELKSQLLSKKVQEKDLELEEQHEFLQNVINGINQSVMVVDTEYNILLANDAAMQLLFKENMIMDTPNDKFYKLESNKKGDHALAPVIDTFKYQKNIQSIAKYVNAMGEEEYVEYSTTPLYNKNHEIYAVIELGHVVTDHLITQKQLEQQKDKLDYQAHYDSLTLLPNRVLFIDRLKHSMEIAKRDNSQVVLMFIDLDHFKEVNDSLGHHAGDFILQECASRLKNTLRKIDTVSRFGGDEFTVMLEKMQDYDDIIHIVQLILNKLKEPYYYQNRKLYSGASVGICIYPENGTTYQELLKNADAAMYNAKERGRNTYCFYTKTMTEKAYERINIETKLREAILADSFIIEYQPLININTKENVGYEALVRWIDSEGNVIYPDKFISILEQTGLIIDIGKIILEKVFLQASQWKKMEIPFDKIAINISVKQLKDTEFFSTIEALLIQCDCDPSWIEFEIIESFIIEDITEAIKILENIRQIGMSISLDDFGTGYSSLSYLKRLPINKLKIDKSFIDDIPFDDNDKVITKTIINLARNMNLEVLAEGVETKAQETFLIVNGCSLAQGYFYDKPLSPDEINRRYTK